jgi:hypothetical protein
MSTAFTHHDRFSTDFQIPRNSFIVLPPSP